MWVKRREEGRESLLRVKEEERENEKEEEGEREEAEAAM